MTYHSPISLEDSFGRRFPYLRLSLTEVCNFRCTYCLPDGYRKTAPHNFLRVDEIRRLVRAFAGLGTWKIRLTGGEPTLRKDFAKIAEAVAATSGVTRLAVTTNGYKLARNAGAYAAAGVTHLNVSIDSLRPEGFRRMTGHDRLEEVLEGIAAARAAGMTVKVNAVLHKGVSDAELGLFQDWVRREPVAVRFIELMQTLDNGSYFKNHYLSGAVIRQRLESEGWSPVGRVDGAGPAVEFAHSDYAGRLGLIAPYAKDFCATCNRLRISSRGALQLCLFGTGGADLRPLLQADGQIEELQDRVLTALRMKTAGHRLHEGISGHTRHLAAIGG